MRNVEHGGSTVAAKTVVEDAIASTDHKILTREWAIHGSKPWSPVAVGLVEAVGIIGSPRRRPQILCDGREKRSHRIGFQIRLPARTDRHNHLVERRVPRAPYVVNVVVRQVAVVAQAKSKCQVRAKAPGIVE